MSSCHPTNGPVGAQRRAKWPKPSALLRLRRCCTCQWKMVSYGLLSSFGDDGATDDDPPPSLRPKTSRGPKKRKERTRTMSKIAKQGAILESEGEFRRRQWTPPQLAASSSSAGSSSTRFLLSTPPKRSIDSSSPSPPSPENTPPNLGAWNLINPDLASPRGAGKRGCVLSWDELKT